MFSIKFKDVVVFGNFLSINEIDFVDVFLDKNQVKFISNSNEVYAEYRAASLCSVNQESFSCRISKSFLKSIGQEDVITIACSDGEVRISLYSGKGSLLYSCSFLQQVVAVSSYADRVLLAENIKGLPVFNLGLLEGLYQIARFNGGLVTVDGGAGAVMLKEAGAVYKEIAGIAESFTVTNKALACLKKCSNNVGSLKDMLVAVNGGFTVFVQKSRMETLEDYSVLVSGRFGAKYTADINLHNLFRFLYKTKINADSVKINVKTCECVISIGHCVYTIPVIAIGKALKLSPPFPPLHTGHAAFTAPGVPSNQLTTLHRGSTLYALTVHIVLTNFTYFCTSESSLIPFRLCLAVSYHC